MKASNCWARIPLLVVLVAGLTARSAAFAQSKGIGIGSNQPPTAESSSFLSTVVFPMSHQARTVMLVSPGSGQKVQGKVLNPACVILLDGKPIDFSELKGAAVGTLTYTTTYNPVTTTVTKMELNSVRFDPLSKTERTVKWPNPSDPAKQFGADIELVGLSGQSIQGFLISGNDKQVVLAPGRSRREAGKPTVFQVIQLVAMSTLGPIGTPLETYYVNPLTRTMESNLHRDALRLGAGTDADMKVYRGVARFYEKEWDQLTGLEKVWVFRLVEHAKEERARAAKSRRELAMLTVFGGIAFLGHHASQGVGALPGVIGGKTPAETPAPQKSGSQVTITGRVPSRKEAAYWEYGGSDPRGVLGRSLAKMKSDGTFSFTCEANATIRIWAEEPNSRPLTELFPGSDGRGKSYKAVDGLDVGTISR